jgi:hypothetical protein
MELHWLDIEYRIRFKVLVLIYKCCNDPTFPKYLSELIKPQATTSNLRGNQLRILPRNYRKATIGGCALSCMGGKFWNELPLEVRQANNLNVFKKRLKTFLFNINYRHYLE